MSQKDIYGRITDMVIKELESGVIPWVKPWTTEWGTNALTKKEYRGINTFILALASKRNGFKSKYWATLKQINQLGGKVKSGSKHERIIFYKPIVEKDPDTEEEKTRIILKEYCVFNIDQTEGLKLEEGEKVFKPIEEGEKVIKEYIKKEGITTTEGGNEAYYNPKEDRINIPKKETFHREQGYYATYFHEIAHSTGHKTRLNRDGVAKIQAFGSHEYSKEELIAEMTSCFLREKTGINTEPDIKNTSAYIKSWIKALKKDKRMLLSASNKGQKATEYILKSAEK